jgi:signal transduction histidine kinase
MKTTLPPGPAGLDALIGCLGHELRSPVAAALLHLGAAEQMVSGLDHAGEALSSVTHARQALATLDRFIDRTLEVYRRGKISLHRERIDLGRLIAQVLDGIWATSPAARSQITVTGAEGAVGWLDRTAVEEILSNLLSNAVKFGEGKPVHLAVDRQPDGVRLLVRDRGAGIELDEQAQVFEPFVRGSSTVPVPGLGLGLWIVRQMVQAHGGRITVDSRPGEGTLFDVYLPA